MASVSVILAAAAALLLAVAADASTAAYTKKCYEAYPPTRTATCRLPFRRYSKTYAGLGSVTAEITVEGEGIWVRYDTTGDLYIHSIGSVARIGKRGNVKVPGPVQDDRMKMLPAMSKAFKIGVHNIHYMWVPEGMHNCCGARVLIRVQAKLCNADQSECVVYTERMRDALKCADPCNGGDGVRVMMDKDNMCPSCETA